MPEPPSVRTIGRILRRQGLLDGQRRVRRAAPPAGWYLPGVAQQRAELDSFDVVEDLRMENLGLFQLFTTRSLWGALVEPGRREWPRRPLFFKPWKRIGSAMGFQPLPSSTTMYAFKGGHNHPDAIGRVMRFCLALGVTPVFAPPLETGFQAVIENFNGLWQQKVWARFHHENLAALNAASQRFTQAYRNHLARRCDPASPRRLFPKDWSIDWQTPPVGTLIYLRRTNERGAVKILGHTWESNRSRRIACSAVMSIWSITASTSIACAAASQMSNH